jgi:hypothetical protein
MACMETLTELYTRKICIIVKMVQEYNCSIVEQNILSVSDMISRYKPEMLLYSRTVDITSKYDRYILKRHSKGHRFKPYHMNSDSFKGDAPALLYQIWRQTTR